ncbi:PDIA3-like protein [Mya arenaria]|uniref:protein disulfide-isomerase n=1 Tax=Mya arenaria TaxID=6604 RepID=A0ABY7DVB4_MYAAR|nr:PDIA3-like protein [Mya arenaria]
MIISVAIFAFLSLASASDVLDLTDANFASKIADQDVVLVDCTENTEICGKHGVSGYPTLKIFRNGEFSEDYNGAREADGIVKTMRSKAGPASKELKTVADAEKFVASSEYGIIGFFSSEDNDAAKTFQKVATSMNSEMRFAHSYNEDINKKYAVNDDIVLFQPKRLQSKFEDAQRKYNDDMTVFKVKNWISANRVMKVAKKFQDAGKTVTFAVSSSTDFAQELAEFGIEGASGDKPVVAGRDSKNQKFVMSDEFSMDNLEKFVNDLLDGKLEAYMKSEAVPDNTQNAVKVAVAKNFAEVVSEDKDVLIEFYAPWCGHCKQLEPKYTELAEKLADESEVVIAKMDATANDVPPQFEGGREVDDFVKYLAKEASTELNSYTRDGKKKKAAKKVEL